MRSGCFIQQGIARDKFFLGRAPVLVGQRDSASDKMGKRLFPLGQGKKEIFQESETVLYGPRDFVETESRAFERLIATQQPHQLHEHAHKRLRRFPGCLQDFPHVAERGHELVRNPLRDLRHVGDEPIVEVPHALQQAVHGCAERGRQIPHNLHGEILELHAEPGELKAHVPNFQHLILKVGTQFLG